MILTFETTIFASGLAAPPPPDQAAHIAQTPSWDPHNRPVLPLPPSESFDGILQVNRSTLRRLETMLGSRWDPRVSMAIDWLVAAGEAGLVEVVA
ncbi:MAG: hypothetical protein HC924_14325 [Synechococcaceae cyanobacterium SM2_3_2]|nr:hypothetical protein [Synechococcaceae cyanobacterium SM2_3_2]